MNSNPLEPKKNDTPSRRRFIKAAAALGFGAMIVPRHVLGGKGFIAPSDKLNIAGVGIGGRGRGILEGASQRDKNTGATVENIVALCDVDDNYAAPTFAQYPNAKRYKDYRKMLEEMRNDIDAVMVATPDHTHAPIAMAAMRLDKHVYVEKPLTHDIYEARMLTETARSRKLITQMGNHGNSSEDIRRICEWIWAGTIGKVREVHCWTNRPVWPQGLLRPKDTPPVPAGLDWDLWLGPAPERPYNPAYHPFSWRGWWDFGTGALGDMACHIVDPVFKALKLTYPSLIEASVPPVYTKMWSQDINTESAPTASMIHFNFPARSALMPAVRLTWYDGNLRPPRPAELGPDEPMGSWDGGVMFVGDLGKIMCGCYASNPTLLPTSKMRTFREPRKTIPRVRGNHQTSWVKAIKENNPALASSNFAYAGPLTEMILIGNLAIRSLDILEKVKNSQGEMEDAFTGRKQLVWDAKNLKISNYEPANQFIKREYRKGWEL
jgi:predicted dehydrogenase